tara:strand:+ start:23 stop:229 length:207 start_codon:yes stop_codon:yes gene_type:complete
MTYIRDTSTHTQKTETKMRTEITELVRHIKLYHSATNQKDFERAKLYLKKVHNKYGTCNVLTIKEIIR